jgi:hypothetical protein
MSDATDLKTLPKVAFVVRVGSRHYLRLDGLKPFRILGLTHATRFDTQPKALGAAQLASAVSGEACNLEIVSG